MWIHVYKARYPHLEDIQHIPLFVFDVQAMWIHVYIAMYPHSKDILLLYVLTYVDSCLYSDVSTFGRYPYFSMFWLNVDSCLYSEVSTFKRYTTYPPFCIGTNDGIRKKVIKHNVFAEISVL